MAKWLTLLVLGRCEAQISNFNAHDLSHKTTPQLKLYLSPNNSSNDFSIFTDLRVRSRDPGRMF
jgi:hypothetical protein